MLGFFHRISMIKFSIVIPIYNEEGSIEPLYFSLKKVMEKLKQSYEIIFVNDSSTDRSLQALNGINTIPANLIIVNLCRHSGESAALQAGFDIARGEIIITMDGDCQNDPEDIPDLLNKMDAGLDVVCGWRYSRKDPWDKVVASKIANSARRIIMKEKIHDVGCTLRVFKRSVLKNVYLSKGMHRFFTLIMAKLGYRIGEIKVRHYPRRSGRSKYHIWNRLRGIMDLITISKSDIYELTKRKTDYAIKEVIKK